MAAPTVIGVAGCATSTSDSVESSTSANSVFQMAGIEPDNGRAPLLEFINSARQSIDVVIYQFNDDEIQQALTDAAKQGKDVRVLFTWQTYLYNNTYADPTAKNFNKNTPTYNALKAAGVNVAWSRKDFPYTHQKSVVVDAGTSEARALIVDYNFQPPYFEDATSPYDPNQSGTRGFGVITSDQDVVSEMSAVFNADWPPYSAGPQLNNPSLVWSPSTPQFAGEPAGNSDSVLSGMITGANKSLDVYMYLSDHNDTQLNDVIAAAKRGVEVRFVANCGALQADDLERAQEAGLKIVYQPASPAHPSQYMFIHTKSIVADFGTDQQKGYVGSVNIFLEQSLDQLREAGAILTDSPTLGVVNETFDRDFNSSKSSCPASLDAGARKQLLATR